MISQTIISLAILKVNWDTHSSDFLEAFVTLTAEATRLLSDEFVSAPALQKDIRRHFGLDLPQNVIRLLLTRLKTRGFLVSEKGAYKKNHAKLATLNFKDSKDKVVIAYEEFISAFQKFCLERYTAVVDEKSAETALLAFFKQRELQIVASSSVGSAIPRLPEGPKDEILYFISEFVQEIQSSSTQLSRFLEMIAKGNMLANAAFLPEVAQTPRRFSDTTLYFDTSFLVYALGYGTVERQGPCRELLDLCRAVNAQTACFVHTVDEIRGILDACGSKLRSNDLASAYGPTIEYFLRQGMNASDVALLSSRLEKDLMGLGIHIHDTPTYVPEYTIDETGLEGYLKDQMLYKELPLRRDVLSISAIFLLRKGRQSSRTEDCRALFVTTNGELASVVRRYFKDNAKPGSISACITDYSITTIMWLKNPQRFPELPLKLIIADAYAAHQIPEHLWHLYLGEIERLQKAKRFDEDDVFLLRNSLHARSALMDFTHGVESAFSEGTVFQIMELIKHRMTAEARDQATVERTKREEAESRLTAIVSSAPDRLARIAARAGRIAGWATKVAFAIGFVGLTVGSLYTMPWDLPKVSDGLAHYCLTVLQVGLLVLSISNLAIGTTLREFAMNFHSRVTRLIYEMIVRLSS